MLAPLYDVLSTQPMFDAGQIQKKKWKLSMAVGRQRHYEEHMVQPRHYLQTAKLCGVQEKLVFEIFDELIAASGSAVDSALNSLPRNFPPKLVSSIVTGMKGRLGLLADFTKDAVKTV